MFLSYVILLLLLKILILDTEGILFESFLFKINSKYIKTIKKIEWQKNYVIKFSHKITKKIFLKKN